MSLSVWRAVGDFVVLSKDNGKSNSGLILDAPYVVTSVGESVPTDITEGVNVVLFDDEKMTVLDPSDSNSPHIVHYKNICAATYDGGEVVPVVHLRGF